MPQATPVTCWLQSFILFVAVGGFSAHFIAQCDYIGALFKFKKVARNLLMHCAVQEEQVEELLQFMDRNASGLPTAAPPPPNTYFSEKLFYTPPSQVDVRARPQQSSHTHSPVVILLKRLNVVPQSSKRRT